MGLFDKFIRVGDAVINTEAIIRINLRGYNFSDPREGRANPFDAVHIILQDSGRTRDDFAGNSLFFTGDDAEALRWLLSNKADDHLSNLTDFWRDIIKAEQLDKDRGHAK